MRKTLDTGSDQSPLQGFFANKLISNISDARENPADFACVVGHPQGMIDVPLKKGFIYVQRLRPDGGSTVLEVYVPSYADGEPREEFREGDVICPKRTSDTNPTYYRYDGMPPGDEPDPPEGGEYKEFGNLTCAEAEDIEVINFYMRGGGGGSSGAPTYPEVENATGGSGIWDIATGGVRGNKKAKATPQVSKTPPNVTFDGQLWQSEDTNIVYRRVGGSKNGYWVVQAGPFSGTYLSVKVTNVAKNKIVAQSTTEAIVADRTVPTTKNAALGLTITAFTTGTGFVTIVCQGLTPFTHGYTPGSPLYLDTSGNITATEPTSGYVQRVGTAMPNNFIYVNIEPVVETGSQIATYKAGASITAGRLVVKNSTNDEVIHADRTTAAHQSKVVGIAMADVSSGADVDVLLFGEYGATTGYAAGTVLFLGTDGQITDTAPAQGSNEIWQIIGTVKNTDTIKLALGVAILRSSTVAVSAATLTTEGDLLYHNGTGLARLPIGTDGQVLTVDSTGNPAWEDATGGGTTGVGSIDGVSPNTPGGNIDLVAGTGIGITPNNATDSIEIANTGVTQIEGLTGNVNIVDGVGITTSAVGSNLTINGTTVNDIAGDVTIAAGANITVTNDTGTKTVTIAATGGASGVSSIESVTGAVNLVEGTNVTISVSGQDITISAAGTAGNAEASIPNGSGATMSRQWVNLFLDSGVIKMRPAQWNYKTGELRIAHGYLNQNTIANGDSGTVLFVGLLTGLTGLTKGVTYYGDPDTAGSHTDDPELDYGRVQQWLMVAKSTTEAWIKPNDILVPSNTALNGYSVFLPSSITSLKGWWKADSLSGSLSNNDPVANWSDSSGNSNDLSQGTSGNRPLFKTNIQNGLPMIEFDGSDDRLDNLAFSPNFTSTGITIFVVGTIDKKTTAACRFISTNATTGNDYDNGVAFCGSSGGTGYSGIRRMNIITSRGTYDVALKNQVFYAEPAIMAIRISAGGISDRIFQLRANGENLELGEPNTNGINLAYVRLGGALLSGSTFGDQLGGKIGEVLIFNEAITNSELRKTELYLAKKWKILIAN